MSEKIYKVMVGTGVGSLVLGIIVLCTGLAAGVLMILNGAKLLKMKADILI